MRWKCLALACLATGAAAQPPAVTPMLAAIRARDWAAAQALAAANPDRVAPDLVTFLRLLAPGEATATEIDGFIATHPTWPDQQVLARRRDEALATEPDAVIATKLCAAHPQVTDAARLRCAALARAAGDTATAANLARAAWTEGLENPAEAAAFLHDWAAILRPEDEWRRFDRLAWLARPEATAQLARLDTPHRLAGQARLALRQDAPDALARLAAVPPDLRADPTLILENARSLRRTKADAAALALWRDAATTAEVAAPPDRETAFIAERGRLARALIADGDAAGAASVVTDPHATAAPLDFLAGWIALRRLHGPQAAATAFRRLLAESTSVAGLARANDWLGRAEAEAGHEAAAHAAWQAAAASPTTLPGQLAAASLGETPASLAARIAALRDPPTTEAAAQAMDAAELARAARLLVAWGDARRARDFVLALGLAADTPETWSLAAHLALSLDLPDAAVAIARIAARHGTVLPQSGWPAPFTPPDGADPALVLAVARQESSFDPEARSPAGARGLMQVMPAAHAAALFDPATNLRLGSAYLRQLLDRFGSNVPYALAAYNAGPNRVRDWLTTLGDPAAQPPGGAARDAMLDWIDLIPYPETSDYVARVLESWVVYRARAGLPTDPLSNGAG